MLIDGPRSEKGAAKRIGGRFIFFALISVPGGEGI